MRCDQKGKDPIITLTRRGWKGSKKRKLRKKVNGLGHLCSAAGGERILLPRGRKDVFLPEWEKGATCSPPVLFWKRGGKKSGINSLVRKKRGVPAPC